MGLGCMVGHAAHNVGHNHEENHKVSREELLTILKKRFVKGEISEEEYQAIKKIVLED